jgi:hypothetical protein
LQLHAYPPFLLLRASLPSSPLFNILQVEVSSIKIKKQVNTANTLVKLYLEGNPVSVSQLLLGYSARLAPIN